MNKHYRHIALLDMFKGHNYGQAWSGMPLVHFDSLLVRQHSFAVQVTAAHTKLRSSRGFVSLKVPSQAAGLGQQRPLSPDPLTLDWVLYTVPGCQRV